jgi:hypothetical protein
VPRGLRALNRESERIPRRLRRGKRANHKKDRIPYGRRSLQLAAGIFNLTDSYTPFAIERNLFMAYLAGW